jgi:hypothetical protein
MRRCRTTPSSSSDSDGLDIESCFDAEDEQEETDADTDVDGDDEVDLPDLEWFAREGNADTVPMNVNTYADGDDKADLVCGLLERRTPTRQSTTLIKRTTPMNLRMKMRTIAIVVSSSLT